MNPKIKNILPGFLMPFLISACCIGPSIYKLTPEETQIDYLMGKEIITKEIDSVLVSINFEEQIGSEFAFFIVVKNNYSEPIIFSPEKVFQEVLDEEMEFENQYLDTLYAADPEAKIDNINHDLHSRTNEHEVATGLNTVFGLVNIVSDIASGDSETKLERVVDDINRWGVNQAIENDNYSNRMNHLYDTKDFWQFDAIRKTTLYTEEKASGLLILPVDKKASFVRLHIIVDNRNFVFFYKQVKIIRK